MGAISTPQKRISAGSRKIRICHLLLYSFFKRHTLLWGVGGHPQTPKDLRKAA